LLIFLLRSIFIPFLIAFLIAYILDPLVDFLEKRKMRRGLAVGLVVTILFAVFLGIMSVLAPAAFREISDFYNKIPQYKEVIKGWVKESGFLKQINFLLDKALSVLQKNFGELNRKNHRSGNKLLSICRRGYFFPY